VWMGAWTCVGGDVVVFTISIAEPGTHPTAPLGVAGSYLSPSQVRTVRRKTSAGR
jgi:hypothetical protein